MQIVTFNKKRCEVGITSFKENILSLSEGISTREDEAISLPFLLRESLLASDGPTYGDPFTPSFKKPQATKFLVEKRVLKFLLSFERVIILAAFVLAIPLRTLRIGHTTILKICG